jgi:ubiquinone/menaquinone biosynthesis C-methylase UbiE
MKNDVGVVCPKCKGELEELDTTVTHCRRCSMQYRVVFAIPDLRYPVVGLENDPEMKIAERLIEAYPRSHYLDLVDLFVSSIDVSNIPGHLVSLYRRHRSCQLVRGQQFTDMFLARLKEHYDLNDFVWALELGCGAGAGLVALSHSYRNVIGIDPSLSQLILARKFCDENNIGNVQLVQAYGQQLPFPDNSFSYATAQNVLEHVFDVEGVIAEVSRVLKPSGCFAADSRNRYDVIFPEPHVQLRGVGLLPRAWANSYVQWRIGMSYEAFHARLLSFGDLQKALRKSFGDHYRIVIPRVSAYDMPKKWDSLLATLERFGWLQQWLTIIFPSHLALAQKQGPG